MCKLLCCPWILKYTLFLPKQSIFYFTHFRVITRLFYACRQTYNRRSGPVENYRTSPRFPFFNCSVPQFRADNRGSKAAKSIFERSIKPDGYPSRSFGIISFSDLDYVSRPGAFVLKIFPNLIEATFNRSSVLKR